MGIIRNLTAFLRAVQAACAAALKFSAVPGTARHWPALPDIARHCV
ncbi:hypothetical protein APV28_4236 [Comamonas testosteroni]|nr:hypothetical protein APV28_4236 [Comamonas testosteroni]